MDRSSGGIIIIITRTTDTMQVFGVFKPSLTCNSISKSIQTESQLILTIQDLAKNKLIMNKLRDFCPQF
jgi:hypothetical protein